MNNKTETSELQDIYHCFDVLNDVSERKANASSVYHIGHDITKKLTTSTATTKRLIVDEMADVAPKLIAHDYTDTFDLFVNEIFNVTQDPDMQLDRPVERRNINHKVAQSGNLALAALYGVAMGVKAEHPDKSQAITKQITQRLAQI